MRTMIPLNSNWQFVAGFDNHYIKKGCPKGSEVIDIPHQPWVLPESSIRAADLHGEFTYACKIPAPEMIPGDLVFLRFEGVQAVADVYVNGELVQSHKGGYTPFQINLTSAFAKKTEALVVVRVDTHEDPSVPPFGHVVDYLSYGGIYREVNLVILNKTHMDNVRVTTPTLLSIDVATFLTFQLHPSTLLRAVLRNREGQEVYREDHVAKPGDNTFSIAQPLQRWSIDDPYLYTLTLQLIQNDIMYDEWQHRVGVRTIEFRPGGFLLNGKPVYLRGLNRHQAYPHVGDAMPSALQYEDARILKQDLGCTIVRTSHYPQSTHFLDACDEYGLLVFEEIPGWQHIGNDEWQQLAIQNVRDMIERDRTHPSIILWGVRINESQDHHEFYTATNQLARQLDPTRPTGGVRNFKDSEFLEDVYTYNDFSHQGTNPGVLPAKEVIKKEVPYLVTEYNGHMFPTKKDDREAQRLEHALRHHRVMQDAMKLLPTGAIGWCLFDYPTHEQFGHPDRICYHGVLDFHRIPKLAAAPYQVKQLNEPVLVVSTSYNPGAHPAAALNEFYVFSNCETVELYKGDDLIQRFVPTEGIVHITDLIGNLLVDKEGVQPKDSDTLKKLLWAVSAKGVEGLALNEKLSMLGLLKKYKWSQADAARLFTTYVGNWGSETAHLHVKGYRNGKLVQTITLGPSYPHHLQSKISHDEVTERGTYQMVRVTVWMKDNYNQVFTDSHHIVQCLIKGPGQIVGPSSKTLVGGSTAFYIRTMHEAGTISYTIKADGFDKSIGDVEVKIEG